MMKWSENELYLQMKITVHNRWRKGKFLKNFLCDRWGQIECTKNQSENIVLNDQSNLLNFIKFDKNKKIG